MAELSPLERLRSARTLLQTAHEQGLDTDLPAVAVRVSLLPGYDPQDDKALLDPCIILEPVPHPVLEALLETSGATRRGRLSWVVGLGEDFTPTPLQVVTNRLMHGILWAESMACTTRGSKNLHEARRYNNGNAISALAVGTRADAVIGYGRIGQLVNWDFPVNGAGQFGAVTISRDTAGRVIWIKIVTHLAHNVPEHLRSLVDRAVNLRPAGRPFTDPRPMRAPDAVAVLEYLAGEGVCLLDDEETHPIAQLRHRVAETVIAYPTIGRPALAETSIGRKVFRIVGNDRLPIDPPVGAAAAGRGRMRSEDVMALVRSLPEVHTAIHPGTEDAGAMALAAPLDDPELKVYQRTAAGLHETTTIGYVNACPVGTGKTVMTYRGMRARSAKQRAGHVSDYRGLVVTEASLRAQWVTEADTWFPEATVVRIESRADAAHLADQLAAAGSNPLVAVMSFGLLSAVAEEIALRESGALDVASTVTIDQAWKVLIGSADTVGQLSLFAAADEAGDIAVEDGDVDQDEPVVRLGQVLLDTGWDDLIADEAEVLRGTGAQASALWELRHAADVGVVLTGTPINKGIDDLGRLISWVRNDLGLFHGVKLSTQFDVNTDEGLADFREAMGALWFRATVEEEMPTIVPTVMPLTPSPEEKALAGAARDELKRVYDELVSWVEMVEATDPGNPNYAQAKSALEEARGAWLGGTTLARMVSSDPAALLESTSAGAALLAGQGLVAAATAKPGTKRTAVIADVVGRVGRGEQILVFTEFASVAKGLIADLDASGVRVGSVLGGGGRARDRMVAEFQAGDLDVLVCTASGERGLNLQMANTIIHYDLPWTPKGVVQRTGRARRLKSENQRIEVVFPLLLGTIEERVAQLVVHRAVEAMQVLDASRGVDVSTTEIGLALSGLVEAIGYFDGEVGEGGLEMTRALVA